MSSQLPPLTQYRAAAHAWCKSLLTRYLHRYWFRAVGADGQLDALVVSLDEVATGLGETTLTAPYALPPKDEVDAAVVETTSTLSALREAHPDLPVSQLQRRLGLDARSVSVVEFLSVIQSEPSLARLATFAWADFGQKRPSTAFVIEALADDRDARDALELIISPGALLRRLGVVHLGGTDAHPFLTRPVTLAGAVRRCINGHPPFSDDYPPGAYRVEVSGPTLAELVLPKDERVGDVLTDVINGRSDAPALLIGEPGSGRRTLARAHALQEHRVLLVVDLSALPTAIAPFERQFTALLRDGLLAESLVLVRCDRLEDRADPRIPVMVRALRTIGPPTVLAVRASHAPHLLEAMPELHSLVIDAGDDDTRRKLYAQLLVRNAFEMDGRQLTELADTYRLRPGDLQRALKDVRTGSDSTAALNRKAFDDAVRRQVRSRLSDLATAITTSQTWDDLVVNAHQRAVMDEIVAHARYRTQVFEEWGFTRKIGGRGRGLSCLFSGPPGTGKTMTAALIAKQLGLDLFLVDLSRIVDKYVGETEKNLARLFDEASQLPVVLLFDEADSLFAARTKVESSNDRYANLEVNFLLQRMERFEGISILTSNMATSIDPAFKRRLRFRLHFELPDAQDRERMWRAMIPASCQIETNIDWTELAQRWEISGALIRNAALRAAFLAAARGVPINEALLTTATRSELEEMGRLSQ